MFSVVSRSQRQEPNFVIVQMKQLHALKIMFAVTISQELRLIVVVVVVVQRKHPKTFLIDCRYWTKTLLEICLNKTYQMFIATTKTFGRCFSVHKLHLMVTRTNHREMSLNFLIAVAGKMMQRKSNKRAASHSYLGKRILISTMKRLENTTPWPGGF